MRILYTRNGLYGKHMSIMRNNAENHLSGLLLYRKHLTPTKFTFGHSVVTLNTQ